MPSAFPRSPRILKGAIVSFDAPFLVPVPNIILFQYNPETVRRTLSPFTGADEKEKKGTKGTVQPFDPQETFKLDLMLDATDALEEPTSHPVAVVSGVADRIAALEMLLYPQGEESLLGNLLGSVSLSLSGGASAGGSATVAAKAVPPRTVPVTLFVWGPGRLVPVRLTSFSVDEQAFSPTLYPVQAKASLGMKVLTPQAFPKENRNAAQEIAVFAYNFTRGQKEILAMANVANSVESILGMLPL